MALNAHFASAHVRWRFILFKYYLWSEYMPLASFTPSRTQASHTLHA
jgi:hypothetical protein